MNCFGLWPLRTSRSWPQTGISSTRRPRSTTAREREVDRRRLSVKCLSFPPYRLVLPFWQTRGFSCCPHRPTRVGWVSNPVNLLMSQTYSRFVDIPQHVHIQLHQDTQIHQHARTRTSYSYAHVFACVSKMFAYALGVWCLWTHTHTHTRARARPRAVCVCMFVMIIIIEACCGRRW